MGEREKERVSWWWCDEIEGGETWLGDLWGVMMRSSSID